MYSCNKATYCLKVSRNMFPLAILERVQAMWVIPLDGIPHRFQAQRLKTEVQEISEEWGDSKPGVLAVDDYGVIRVKTTMTLIGRTLLAVLSYFHTRYEPESYVGEALELQGEVTESALYIARTTRAQKFISTWDEIIIQEGGIQCDVRAQWTLERDTLDAHNRLAFNAGICD